MAIVALAGFAWATPGMARFVSQENRNGAHYCRYLAPGMTHRPANQARAALNSAFVEVRIPPGARCSATLPTIEPPPRQSVPIMSVLTRETRVAGQRYCVYTYEGREYSTLAAAASSCPLTPRP